MINSRESTLFDQNFLFLPKWYFVTHVYLIGPIGLDGNECYLSCPITNCPMVNMEICPGGYDENGCKMPDTCVPIAG